MRVRFWMSVPRFGVFASLRNTGSSCLYAILLIAIASLAFAEDNSTSGSAKTGFQWKKAIAESFVALSAANAYRVVTQPETRADIRGPFWAEYAESMENLHGWNDGDGLFTSYILHPMEGGFAAFIERQNDPEYSDVEFGLSERYWVSSMRSLAFSTAYSMAWSASPLGEPGVANVELHNKPGLVDLVDTETIGYGWMVMEDAIDRYVILRLERHVRNPYVRAFVRSTLNPMRSYANTLALRVPWHRDSRPGVFQYNPKASEPQARDSKSETFRADAWPETRAFEILGEPVLEHFGGPKKSTCFGSGAEGTVKSAAADVVFDLDGCVLSGFGRDEAGDTLNYLLGPRWRIGRGTSWTPFAQILVGGTKITHTMLDEKKEQELSAEAWETHGLAPDYASYHTEIDTNGFTMIASAGVTYRQNNLLSWRVANVGYKRSWMLDRLQGFDYNHGLRIETGLAVTFGPWRR